MDSKFRKHIVNPRLHVFTEDTKSCQKICWLCGKPKNEHFDSTLYDLTLIRG